MIQEITTKLYNAINPDRMKHNLENLCRFPRHVVTAGFTKAAEECVKILEQDGLNPELLKFDASVGTCYNTDTPPLKWTCRDAWCELENENGRRIGDYQAKAMTLLERSCAVPETVCDLVLMDKGTDEANYEGIDFEGKVIFCPADVNHRWDAGWAFKKGAVGCIVVHDAGPRNPDTIEWDGVGRGTEPGKYFGFAMPKAAGTELYWSLRRKQRDGEKLQVRCYVDAEFSNGEVEIVTATIPGELDEEVVIVAHLCHPQGSCNDNLSGCVAGMEVLRAIKRQIERGELNKPKRGIRLLLVPEILGSNVYMATRTEEERRRMVAGINLDMVGATQNDHNGPLLINEPPQADPSFVTALCSAILEVLREDERITGRYGYVSLFNAQIMEYRGGSDHVVYCDPNCGIPMPMVGQEPDRFYHTSDDDPTCMDYFILRKSATLAAAYCYAIMDMNVQTMNEVSFHINQRVIDRIAMAARKSLAGDFDHADYDRRMEQLNYFYGNMYDSFVPFMDTDEDREKAKELAAEGKEEVLRIVKTYGKKAYGVEPEFTGCRLRGGKWDRIPKRRYFGATQALAPLAKKVGPAAEAALEHYENNGRNHMWSHSEHQCEYYINGKRTCGEIVDMTRREVYLKCTDESLLEYIDTLVALELADYIN